MIMFSLMCMKYGLSALIFGDALFWHFLHCRWGFLQTISSLHTIFFQRGSLLTLLFQTKDDNEEDDDDDDGKAQGSTHQLLCF